MEEVISMKFRLERKVDKGETSCLLDLSLLGCLLPGMGIPKESLGLHIQALQRQ
jgi:hypothetical protein